MVKYIKSFDDTKSARLSVLRAIHYSMMRMTAQMLLGYPKIQFFLQTTRYNFKHHFANALSRLKHPDFLNYVLIAILFITSLHIFVKNIKF